MTELKIPWRLLASRVQAFYRPQRSWGKVISSEACVKNSVHRGACIAGGACMAEGACMAGDGGHMWQGGMHGRGHAWQGGKHGRRHAWQGGMCGMHAAQQILHDMVNDNTMSGQYASYWNAFF